MASNNSDAPKLETKQSAEKLLDVIYKLQRELHHAQKDAVFPPALTVILTANWASTASLVLS